MCIKITAVRLHCYNILIVSSRDDPIVYFRVGGWEGRREIWEGKGSGYMMSPSFPLADPAPLSVISVSKKYMYHHEVELPFMNIYAA